MLLTRLGMQHARNVPTGISIKLGIYYMKIEHTCFIERMHFMNLCITGRRFLSYLKNKRLWCDKFVLAAAHGTLLRNYGNQESWKR